MADKSVVHIGENSAEEVALKLFQTIAAIEKRSISETDADELESGWSKADRAYVLSTYAECFSTVRDGYYSPKK